MLKKYNRLAGLKIRTKGQSLDTPLFKIKVFAGKNDELKFGFVVSKKIDKRAVIRNRTKRVLKNAARRYLKKAMAGQRLIIYAKKSLDFSQADTVSKELERVLEDKRKNK